MSRSGAGVTFRVYVMLGEVLAAQSDHDDDSMLGILLAAGHVDGARYAALRSRMATGGVLSESLFDTLPEALLLELLFERFRENLFQFLSDTVVTEFLPMDAVFVENIQVGHDSRELLDELVGLGQRIRSLQEHPEMLIGPGATFPDSDIERALVHRSAARTRLAELVGASPWEPTRVLEHVRRMLDEGMLVGVMPESDDELMPDEDTADAPLPGLLPSRAAPMSEEDDLAAFQDYDTQREPGAFLTDRTLLDRVDLDVAGVAELAASTETLIEMEDAEGKDVLKSAVSLNFSGPKLHDEEILRKLEVTNEVLATIAAAIEAADGRGAGGAKLQLLIEGTSVPLAPLFKGIEVGTDGRLPIAQVMKNLRKRPAGEHRRLLNRGLSDLIERALSAADEVLDVDGFEIMLEQLAGYQQRLGV
ncbi:MAG: hypothetical protein Q8P41_14300 [Pseudomonadota bacterium]|nr:hypothetical protein [Pseudomonadota bacterium]